MGNDKIFIRRDVEIAVNGIHHEGGRFGAVITRTGNTIYNAFHSVILTHHPTAHDDILAIRDTA